MDLGLHRKAAAKLLGAHATIVANWEKDRAAPAVWHLPKVIQFLGYDPRPKPSTVADRLKQHRTALGLSQEAMSKRLGVDPTTLRRWESGGREPQGEYLAKIEGIFLSPHAVATHDRPGGKSSTPT